MDQFNKNRIKGPLRLIQVEGWKQRLATEVDNTSEVDVNFLICNNDFKKQDSSFYWSTFYGSWNNDNNLKHLYKLMISKQHFVT